MDLNEIFIEVARSARKGSVLFTVNGTEGVISEESCALVRGNRILRSVPKSCGMRLMTDLRNTHQPCLKSFTGNDIIACNGRTWKSKGLFQPTLEFGEQAVGIRCFDDVGAPGICKKYHTGEILMPICLPNAPYAEFLLVNKDLHVEECKSAEYTDLVNYVSMFATANSKGHIPVPREGSLAVDVVCPVKQALVVASVFSVYSIINKGVNRDRLSVGGKIVCSGELAEVVTRMKHVRTGEGATSYDKSMEGAITAGTRQFIKEGMPDLEYIYSSLRRNGLVMDVGGATVDILQSVISRVPLAQSMAF